MYGPGELLYQKGEIDNKFYYIVKGEVELFVDTPCDKDAKILA